MSRPKEFATDDDFKFDQAEIDLYKRNSNVPSESQEGQSIDDTEKEALFAKYDDLNQDLGN